MACRTIGAMRGGSLCPAISSGRSFVGWDVRGEVGPYPARRLVPRDPLAPLFVLAAPEGVYPSAVGMPISPPLLRAACPRQNTEKY
jgi:hypothetical protein